MTTHSFSIKKYHTMIVGTIEITLDDGALILLRGCSAMRGSDREIARRMVERALDATNLYISHEREFVKEEK